MHEGILIGGTTVNDNFQLNGAHPITIPARGTTIDYRNPR